MSESASYVVLAVLMVITFIGALVVFNIITDGGQDIEDIDECNASQLPSMEFESNSDEEAKEAIKRFNETGWNDIHAYIGYHGYWIVGAKCPASLAKPGML